MNDSVAETSRRYGFTSEELASRSTVFGAGSLAGRRFIISGGGGGMGRAMAFLMTRLGANVMICGRDESKLAGVAGDVSRLLGREVQRHAVNIRDPEQVSALMAAAFEGGDVDGVINCAGGQFAQYAIDFSPKGWQAVIDTNLNGTWWMMQQAARQWRQAGRGGAIVNIIASYSRGIPQLAHTAAARAGVAYLSKSVAVEWAPLGIRINCIAPGTIETEGLNSYPPSVTARLGKSNPQRSTGDAWDIAEAAVYLCSPAAKFVTGEVMHVDGGMQLWGNTFPLGTPDHLQGA